MVKDLQGGLPALCTNRPRSADCLSLVNTAHVIWKHCCLINHAECASVASGASGLRLVTLPYTETEAGNDQLVVLGCNPPSSGKNVSWAGLKTTVAFSNRNKL